MVFEKFSAGPVRWRLFLTSCGLAEVTRSLGLKEVLERCVVGGVEGAGVDVPLF